MIFVAPWVLLALPALPLLWWLLRVTPPAPRTEIFPAVRLLAGLPTTEETPARTPWWLLLLRLVAAGAVIIGLAQPVLRAGGSLAGTGPILLVIDDGWAAAADWPQRIAAADAILDRANREARAVRLLTTAPDVADIPPTLTGALSAAEMRARIAALRPRPWSSDRAAAARALKSAGESARFYIADGLTDGADWDGFASALRAGGSVTVLGADPPLARLLLTPIAEADGLRVRLAQVPRPLPETVGVLAQTGDGRSIARLDLTIPGNSPNAEAKLAIPAELRNRLTRLVLDGVQGVGGVMLLDEGFRRRPVGLLAGDATTADVPLTGPLFYVRRALGLGAGAGGSGGCRWAGTCCARRLGRKGRPAAALRGSGDR